MCYSGFSWLANNDNKIPSFVGENMKNEYG